LMFISDLVTLINIKNLGKCHMTLISADIPYWQRVAQSPTPGLG